VNLRTAISVLGSIIKNGSGQSKATALVDLLTDRVLGNGESWTVVARSPRTTERLVSGLKEYGITPPATAISSIAFGHEFDGVVLVGWPNDLRFRRLHDLAVAPEIRVLTYRFERKWLERYRTRSRLRDRMDAMTSERRARVLNFDASYLGNEADASHQIDEASDQTVVNEVDLSVFRFEARVARRYADVSAIAPEDSDETRPARLVRFTGGCYACLTEWAELPLLNELIEKRDNASIRIGRKTISELTSGDFLLFRAAGDKEFIRLIAEEIVGHEEYDRLRARAERWKDALRRLGSSPSTVQRRLADYGLDREMATVGGWLGNPNRIGPGNKEDVEVIARAAGDETLLASIDQVTEAISSIRGAHLSAGMRLTKLLLGELRGRVSEIGDQPTLLDLGYGEAWVVQVEAVENQAIDCPVNKVNKILWVADTGF